MYSMTNRKPETWIELQEMVAHYFNYSGYEAITPYKIETVRGEVEVDVFVKADNELGNRIICECKYWNTMIPQEKIHAFRTVVNDSGVSLGIIISKLGFQKGAILAADKSNIKLFTWEQFLDYLFDKWFAYRMNRLQNLSKPLFVYTDPFDIPAELLSKAQIDEYKKTLLKFTGLNIMIHNFNENTVSKYNETYNESVTTIEEFFNSAEERIKEAISYYEVLFKDVNIPKWKFVW